MTRTSSTLCDCIPEHVQRMVLVAPPKMSLGDWIDSVIVNESNKFGTVYEAIASEKGLTFLNACEWKLINWPEELQAQQVQI